MLGGSVFILALRGSILVLVGSVLMGSVLVNITGGMQDSSGFSLTFSGTLISQLCPVHSLIRLYTDILMADFAQLTFLKILESQRL